MWDKKIENGKKETQQIRQKNIQEKSERKNESYWQTNPEKGRC